MVGHTGFFIQGGSKESGKEVGEKGMMKGAILMITIEKVFSEGWVVLRLTMKEELCAWLV